MHPVMKLMTSIASPMTRSFNCRNDYPLGGVARPPLKVLSSGMTDYFDRAPRGVVLETLHKFGIPVRTPHSSYLRAFRVVVVSTVEKGGPAP